jgi:putative sigma-54 modulation protein
MKAIYQATNFDADQKLINFIQKKLDKLDHFFDRVIEAEVYLKINNTGEKNKTLEIKIAIPGNDIMVSRDAETFEKAMDLAYDVLKRQLRKQKEKLKK